jgi:hypothetical protein
MPPPASRQCLRSADPRLAPIVPTSRHSRIAKSIACLNSERVIPHHKTERYQHTGSADGQSGVNPSGFQEKPESGYRTKPPRNDNLGTENSNEKKLDRQNGQFS